MSGQWLFGVPLAVGGIAWLASLLRLALTPTEFFRGYLPASLFWVEIPLGCLAWLMIHRLTGGRWGHTLYPVLVAGARVLPLNLLLFIPLAFGLARLYPWAAPGWEPGGSTGGQAVWLRPGFFLIREAVVFGLWLGVGAALGVWRGLGWKAWEHGHPGRLPPTGETSVLPRGGGAAAALGLIVYGLTVTVFGIDWLMSLDPSWSSANIGFLSATGHLLAALAFGTLALCLVARNDSWPADTAAPRFGDLGGLLLALVLLWSYLAFQQYLTIWYEDLPEKTLWYVRRTQGGWRIWIWVLAAVAGALPFLLLLSRALKRDPSRLIRAAGLVLAGRLLDLVWQVSPTFFSGPERLGPLDALPFLGIGGLWVAAFVWMLPRVPVPEANEVPPHG